MQRDYTIDTGAVALSAATAAYLIGISTGAVCPIDLVDITVGCDSTSSGSLKVELVSWTSDGTGTAYTPKACNGDASLVAAASAAKVNYSVAPTGSLTVIRTWIFPLPTGPMEIMLPLGREYTQPVSVFRGIRFTSTIGSVNGYATVTFEE